MHFAIRYLTEYHYDAPVTDNLNALRVRPATTSTQRCDEFHTRIEPEARVSRHLDYFGTEVIEFGIPTSHEQLTIDVRARVVTSAPARPARGLLGEPAQRRLHRRRRRVRAALAGPASDRGPREPARGARGRKPAGDARTALRADPRPLRIPPGRHLRRLDRRATCSTLGAGVCQDFVHLSLVLLRRRGIAARYVSGYLWAAPEDDGTRLGRGRHPRLARGAAARHRRSRRAGVGRAPIPPTAASPARPTSRSATGASTPTCPRSRASTWAAPPPS